MALREYRCSGCGKEARRIPPVFASKAGYTLRGPKSRAFHGRQAN